LLVVLLLFFCIHLPCIFAGAVVGILGLEASVLKTVTLASDPYTPSLTPMHFEATPIVRVALEASNIRDMPALKEGMRLLSLADPCVEVRCINSLS
jgi:ribosome assembly protein 1